MTTSATFDAQTILDTVDTWHAPDSWQIHRAERKYFVANGLANLSIALMIATVEALVIVLAIMARNDIHIPWGEAQTYGILLAILLFVLLTAYIFTTAFSLFAQVRSAEKQMLVLTPLGVVGRMGKQEFAALRSFAVVYPAIPWDGARDGRIFAIPYEQLREVRLHITHSKYQQYVQLILVLATSHGALRQVDWLIDGRFSDTDLIAQRIIEAHARYAALQAPAGH